MGTFVVPVKVEVTMGIVVNAPDKTEAAREARRYFQKEYEKNPNRMPIEGKYVKNTAVLIEGDITDSHEPQPRREYGEQKTVHESEG